MQLSPEHWNPSWALHSKLPSVLLQIEFFLHSTPIDKFDEKHSSISSMTQTSKKPSSVIGHKLCPISSLKQPDVHTNPGSTKHSNELRHFVCSGHEILQSKLLGGSVDVTVVVSVFINWQWSSNAFGVMLHISVPPTIPQCSPEHSNPGFARQM